MKQIITIQHTQSVHHTNGMVGSWTDWDLTELGKEQARCIGENLRAQLSGDGWKLYTSDLLRARRTAEIVGHILGLEAIPTVALRERNLGEAVDKSVAWLKENMTSPERTIDDRLFPSAESRRDAWKRLRPFFDQLLESGEEQVIIVAHGDLLGLFHGMWLGVEPEFFNHADFSCAAGSVSFLREDAEGRRRIQRLGDHLALAQTYFPAQQKYEGGSRRHKAQTADLDEAYNHHLTEVAPLGVGIKQDKSRDTGG